MVCVNGQAGAELQATAERSGAKVVTLEFDWGTPVDPDRLRETLGSNPGAKAVAFVQAEASAGVHNDAAALASVAREHDALVIVDAVMALGGVSIDVDARGIDAAFGSSRRCLSGPAGIAPVTLSARAVKAVEQRGTPVQSRLFDLAELTAPHSADHAHPAYYRDASMNTLYGFSEALLMLHEESVATAFARHRQNHEAFCAGVDAMGLRFAVDKPHRLPQINTILVPESLKDEGSVRAMLLDTFNMEIGAGSGPYAGKAWQVSFMGQSCSPSNVLYALAALETVLTHNQIDVEKGRAQDAARAVFG